MDLDYLLNEIAPDGTEVTLLRAGELITSSMDVITIGDLYYDENTKYPAYRVGTFAFDLYRDVMSVTLLHDNSVHIVLFPKCSRS